MSTERINGTKEHLDKWTEEELYNALVYAEERRDEAQGDMDKLIGEIERRNKTELPFTE